MRLRALEIEQFRRFERPVRLAGFGDGVNVLCGPNEFGKSTLLAAIRGLLFERHASRAEPVQRMQNWRGGASPRVALEFELEGALWRAEKRFLGRHPSALLLAPDGARFEGDAAEERLQALLGFAAPGKQGAKPEHMGMWGALWVTQRTSLEQADVTLETARATLTACLDAEVGALAGGERGTALRKAVAEALGRLLDGRGKPKDRYRAAIERLERAEAALESLLVRERALREESDALERVEAELARAGDARAATREAEALAEARRAREAALRFQDQLDKARSDLALAEASVQEARREQASRQERLLALEAGRQARQAASLAEAEARVALTASEATLTARRESLAGAESRAGFAAAAVARARLAGEVLGRAEALARLDDKLAQAEAAQRALADLTARRDAAGIDRAGIEAVRRAAHEETVARAGLDAQATRVTFDLLPGAAGRVTVQGAPADAELTLLREAEIAIEGIGRIRIRPAVQDRDAERHAQAAAVLRTALAAVGCADPAEAEARWTEREALERRLETEAQRLTLLVPGDRAAGLKPGLPALREHVEVLRRRLALERETHGLAELPDRAAAEATLRRAEEAEAEGAATLDQARRLLDQAAQQHTEQRLTLNGAETATRTADEAVRRLEAEARRAEAREGAAALEDRLARAEAAAADRRADLARLERARPADQVEMLDARIQRLSASIEAARQTARRLGEERARLQTGLALAGGAGLHEQIAETRRSIEAETRIRDGFAREAAELALLRDALAQAERAAKERYRAPLTRRIAPYLQRLFPDAEIACDEAFRIAAITRGAAEAERFEALSDGTQEQVAVLARLAFAEMLADQGRPAMVILDDALAYADDERIERMFDILTHAGRKMQILVLTCREDLFARLGGTALRLEPVSAGAGAAD